MVGKTSAAIGLVDRFGRSVKAEVLKEEIRVLKLEIETERSQQPSNT